MSQVCAGNDTRVFNLTIWENEKDSDIQAQVFGAVLSAGGRFCKAYHSDFFRDAERLQKLLTRENIESALANKKRFLLFWAVREYGTEMHCPNTGDDSRWFNASHECHKSHWFQFNIVVQSTQYGKPLLTIDAIGFNPATFELEE